MYSAIDKDKVSAINMSHSAVFIVYLKFELN